MICSRFVSLPAAMVAMTLSSSLASTTGDSGVTSQTNCDFYGGDIGSEAGLPQVCERLCVNDLECTHWSWSNFNGGTCWLKNGRTPSPYIHMGRHCGYAVGRVSSSDSMDQVLTKHAVLDPDPTLQNKSGQKAQHTSHKTSARPQSAAYQTGLTSTETAKMLARINAYRAGQGLAALTIDVRLVAASLVHSQDQAKRCKMDHKGKDGSSHSERIQKHGYDWLVTAENVAAGQMSVSEVMDSWWHSPHHRANILKDDVKNVGFAVASNTTCRTYTSYWTQDFAAQKCDNSAVYMSLSSTWT